MAISDWGYGPQDFGSFPDDDEPTCPHAERGLCPECDDRHQDYLSQLREELDADRTPEPPWDDVPVADGEYPW